MSTASRGARNQVLIVAAGLLLAVVAAAALWLLRDALLLIYISIVFAVVLAPVVDGIRRVHLGGWRPSRGVAVLALGAIVVGAAAAFAFFVVPSIAGDAQQFQHEWPARERQLMAAVHRLPFTESLTAADLQHAAGRLLGRIDMAQLADDAIQLLTTLLVAAYFILDGPRAFAWFISLLPPAQQRHATDTLRRGARKMQAWLGGQAIMMLAHGGSALVTFGLLGVKYWVALGIFAGLINVIPVLGPIITVVVAGVVAAIGSYQKLLGVVIFYVVYHNVEGAFLEPRVMQAKVHIPALAVMVALVVGDAVAGIVGILVSVPSAVLVAVVVDEYVGHRNTGEVARARRAAS
jgi:predicted PurR-regulated permease PerM